MRRSSGSLLLAALAVAWGSAPRDARADDQRTVAQALFDDAVQAMKDKAYDRACPKLEEVVSLQPGKVGAMMQLALCYEEAGKVASAWSRYRAAADAAAPTDPRGAAAGKKADELAAQVPKLTVVVAPENRATPRFTVQRDGRDLGVLEWGAALPIDPGKHELVATAPGKKRWTATVFAVAGHAPETVRVPALSDEAQGPPPVLAVVPVAPHPPAPALAPGAPRKEIVSPPRAGRPTWAWFGTGAGLVGLGVAAGFGIDGLSAKGTIASLCNGQSPCPALNASHASSLNSRKDTGLAVFLGAGAAGLAATTIGLVGLLRPTKAPMKTGETLVVTPAVGPGFAGAVLGGKL